MTNRLATTLTAVTLAVAAFALVPGAASAAPPANDNVASAQTIGPALPVSVPASNLEATVQAGEPSIFSNAVSSSVWFKWTSPLNGTVVVDLCSAGFTGSESPFHKFSVRTGAGFGALVAEQAGECSKRFTAVSGTEYKIQVDYGSDQGNFTFRLRQLAPPANDNFASSTVIGPGLPISVQGTTVDSTWQASEPAALGGSTNSRSVWFTWTAPATEQVRADFCTYTLVSGAGNTTVAVYTGNNLPGLVATIPSTSNCEVSFNAVAGTTYRIAFSGSFSGELNFALNLKSAPPPSNDNFSAAQPVGPNLPVAIQANNEFATVEAGEPDHSGDGFDPARSVWYQWTPSQNQRVSIRACNREEKTRIGVYTGATVNALTRVGERPPYAPHCGILLDAVAGTVYWIAAGGGPQDGAYGAFKLDIHALKVPVNDNFSSATVLALKSSGSIKGTTVDSSIEDGEPSHVLGSYSGDTPSVWYRWKATSRQPVILSACSATEPVRIAVYTDSKVDDLEQIAASETGCPAGQKGGRVAIAPVTGVTYRIAVASGLRDFQGGFTLSSQGSFLPKQKYNLNAALRKCRKIGSKGKRKNCIRKARRQAAISNCQNILDSSQQATCVNKARRR